MNVDNIKPFIFEITAEPDKSPDVESRTRADLRDVYVIA
jgi:hypothetical protein